MQQFEKLSKNRSDVEESESSIEEAENRAIRIEQQMNDDERFDLIYSLMVYVLNKDFSQKRDDRVPPNIPQTAGWVKGVPRSGVPDLVETDAGSGITNPLGGRKGDQATALPSAQALAATFNPKLAYQSGVILGQEARCRGFNVVLGGGMNLARDPRHGRNFEYFSEDPWLSAVMAAETVKGVQAQNVICTLKHVSLNSQEINKWYLDAKIEPMRIGRLSYWLFRLQLNEVILELLWAPITRLTANTRAATTHFSISRLRVLLASRVLLCQTGVRFGTGTLR